MARHSLAPGFCKVYYQTNTHQHVMTLPVKFSGTVTPGITPEIYLKSGEVQIGNTAIAAMLNLVKPFYVAADTFSHMEFWSKPTVESDPIFISSSTIVGLVGTGTKADVPLSEAIWTFRTRDGSTFRFYLMETSMDGPAKHAAPSYGGSAACQALANYIVGDYSPVVGRDGTVPISQLNLCINYSRALYRKFILS